ncbi:MAG: tetratricopeptide repeat protein [Phycisphaerales bacterium]
MGVSRRLGLRDAASEIEQTLPAGFGVALLASTTEQLAAADAARSAARAAFGPTLRPSHIALEHLAGRLEDRDNPAFFARLSVAARRRIAAAADAPTSWEMQQQWRARGTQMGDPPGHASAPTVPDGPVVADAESAPDRRPRLDGAGAGTQAGPGLPSGPTARVANLIRADMTIAELMAAIPAPPRPAAPPRAPDAPSTGRSASENRMEADRRYVRGASAFVDGQTVRAILDLERAAALDPSSVAVRRMLGRAYGAIGNRARAEIAWTAALTIEPGHAESSASLALIRLRQGDPMAALGWLRPWIEPGGEPATVAMVLTAMDAARQLGASGAVLDLADRTREPDFAVASNSSANRARLAGAPRADEPWLIDAVVADALAELDAWSGSLGAAIRAWEGWRLASTSAPSGPGAGYPPIELTTRIVRAALQLGEPAVARAAIAAHARQVPGIRPVDAVDAVDTVDTAGTPPSSAPNEHAIRAADEAIALSAWMLDASDHHGAASVELLMVAMLERRAAGGAGESPTGAADFGAAVLDARARIAVHAVAREVAVPMPVSAALAARDGADDQVRAPGAALLAAVRAVAEIGTIERAGTVGTRILDAGSVRGPQWPHAVPHIAERGGRVLRSLPSPLTLDMARAAFELAESTEDRMVLVAMVEATGHTGEAWRLARRTMEMAGGTVDSDDRATAGTIVLDAADAADADAADAADAAVAAVAAAAADTDAADAAGTDADSLAHAHALLIRLAGQLHDARAVRDARQAATDAGPRVVDDAAFQAAERLASARIESAATSSVATIARPMRPAALRSPLAAPPIDAGDALDTLCATLAAIERAMLLDVSDARTAELVVRQRELVMLARVHPRASAAWATAAWMAGPQGPISDQRRAAELRRIWEAAAPGDPGLRRARRFSAQAAGRTEAVLAAARLDRAVDSSDRLAIQDLLAATERRAGHDVAILEALRALALHPADPGRAEALMRLEVSAISPDVAWTRIRSRLAAAPGDLVAMRLGEIAAGIAGEPLTRLVLAEERLLRRPESPRRSLLIAGLSRDAGQTTEVVEELRRFLDVLDDASGPDILGAASILEQVGGASAIEVTIEMAERIIDRPEPELDDLVLRAVRKTGLNDPAGDRFGQLATAAAVRTLSRRPDQGETILPWRDLAQRFIDAGSPEAAVRALAIRAVVESTMADARPVRRDPADVEQLLATMLIAAESSVAAAAESDPGGPSSRVALLVPRGAFSLDATRAVASEWRVEEASGDVGTITAWVADDLVRSGGVVRFIDGMDVAGDVVGDAAADPAWRRAAALHRGAGMHRLAGANALALDLMREAAATAARVPGLLNDLGYSELESARTAGDAARVTQAIAWIEQAAAAAPRDPSIADSLGWARYHQGQFAEAVPLLERAAAMDDPSPEILLHLGDALWRLDRRDQAAAAWRRGATIAAASGYRSQYEQSFEDLQTGLWGLLVRDPAAMYDAVLAEAVDGIAERLAAVRDSRDVLVTPVFIER